MIFKTTSTWLGVVDWWTSCHLWGEKKTLVFQASWTWFFSRASMEFRGSGQASCDVANATGKYMVSSFQWKFYLKPIQWYLGLGVNEALVRVGVKEGSCKGMVRSDSEFLQTFHSRFIGAGEKMQWWQRFVVQTDPMTIQYWCNHQPNQYYMQLSGTPTNIHILHIYIYTMYQSHVSI